MVMASMTGLIIGIGVGWLFEKKTDNPKERARDIGGTIGLLIGFFIDVQFLFFLASLTPRKYVQ